MAPAVRREVWGAATLLTMRVRWALAELDLPSQSRPCNIGRARPRRVIFWSE